MKLPKLFDMRVCARPGHPVDYYVPGCPPSPKIITEVFQALLSGPLPEPKARCWLPTTPCATNALAGDDDREKLQLDRFHRVHEI